jgi:hypothetical protein
MSYRLYAFVNHLYMSPIQWGIQTAHCVSTLSVKYKHNTEQHKCYTEWAEQEPTIIVCQGGNVAMLNDLYARLEPLANALDLGVVKFHEDEQSLGGVITSVAVLVPDALFNCYIDSYDVIDEERIPKFIRPDGMPVLRTRDDSTEHEFLSIVKLARLA